MNLAIAATPVNPGYGERKRLRTRLLEIWGDACWECGLKMTVPEYGKRCRDMEGMATIEHNLCKTKGFYFRNLRLVHKSCNK